MKKGVASTKTTAICMRRRKSTVDNNDIYFPDDLLVEILHRLPIKSIFRFKCVSKRWFALLSDPCFIHRHSSLTPSPWTLFYQYYFPQMGMVPPHNLRGVHLTSTAPSEVQSQFTTHDGFSLNFLPCQQQQQSYPAPEPVRFLGSSNGLVLCCATREFQMLYYVCNPLTKQWVALPRPPFCHQFVHHGFVCESSSSSPASTSYKVVRFAEFMGPSHILNLEIFSSQTGEWIFSKVSCPNEVIMFPSYCYAVAYNGILHWLDRENRIMAYDPNNNSDQCRLIDLPTDRRDCYRGCLGVSEGCLCFVKLTKLEIDRQVYNLTVWALKDYNGGKWCLEHETVVGYMVAADAMMIRLLSCWKSTCMPLAFHPLDRNVVFLKCIDCIASYNFQSKILEMVCPLPMYNLCLTWWMVFPFVLPPWPTQLPPPSWKALDEY